MLVVAELAVGDLKATSQVVVLGVELLVALAEGFESA